MPRLASFRRRLGNIAGRGQKILKPSRATSCGVKRRAGLVVVSSQNLRWAAFGFRKAEFGGAPLFGATGRRLETGEIITKLQDQGRS